MAEWRRKGFRRCKTQTHGASGSDTQRSPSLQRNDKTFRFAGLLTSVVLQQDYRGVHDAGAGVNRAWCGRDAVLIDSEGGYLVLV